MDTASKFWKIHIKKQQVQLVNKFDLNLNFFKFEVILRIKLDKFNDLQLNIAAAWCSLFMNYLERKKATSLVKMDYSVLDTEHFLIQSYQLNNVHIALCIAINCVYSIQPSLLKPLSPIYYLKMLGWT